VSQPRLYVLRETVRALVDDFLVSPKGREKRYCTSFRPDEMRTCLHAIPVGAYWDGTTHNEWCAYHECVQVVLWFECHKMTSKCNSWTPWMLDRLRRAKVPIAAEFLP
jgi:hypothetical protein